MATTILPIDEVTEALTAQWAAISGLASSLGDDQWSASSVLPGWTNADIVAHIIGTESMLDGRDVEATRTVSALDHVRNPIGELNEKWVDHFRPMPRTEVLAALDEIIGVRTAALRAMGQEAFDAPAMTPAGADTYGRFMRIRIFDCWVHEIDLRDGTDGSSVSDPGPAALALDEIGTSLPFVVGKRADAPKGSAVLFDITGLAPRTVRIVVGDRAGIVDEFDGGDGAADVRIRLDAANLARCAGGRRDADPAAADIEGNEQLGQAILNRMNYVI
ncbi:maleylpyruvate isomerase family mycothiol-dependent enzyme [Gordonia jinghuaiqii]|uniref:Maleylpyruvate isomerase family mycothiol-dependent enzyme n=1 Tax=Gordonia jinghuaiqii TaxID=2758710 RepID=A0A7D7R8I5_9ACTN|nr:maleylpyruvate isomerase family mycothiol-dependent enzyme [Gordonia jinghuaiqii]MCR5977167.1 maleylpyruvate isomerase family mycothiol-dependent enzyme [Gordonia jinghuaiqii]QMT00230.1 maleylpyruvate isomerase family mycothiol-dependent enzyme [Gordonia jinghuaiqii]